MLPLIAERCPVVVGFKAESGLSEQDLCDRARSRMDSYGLYAVVANDVSCAGAPESSVCIVTRDGVRRSRGGKRAVADDILDVLKGSL